MKIRLSHCFNSLNLFHESREYPKIADFRLREKGHLTCLLKSISRPQNLQPRKHGSLLPLKQKAWFAIKLGKPRLLQLLHVYMKSSVYIRAIKVVFYRMLQTEALNDRKLHKKWSLKLSIDCTSVTNFRALLFCITSTFLIIKAFLIIC